MKLCSRKKGVRFIAINNSVDSANPTDNDLTLAFEYHERVVCQRYKQQKSRQSLSPGMQKGLRCSGSIPYGYKRTKDDKQQLYVDEPRRRGSQKNIPYGFAKASELLPLLKY